MAYPVVGRRLWLFALSCTCLSHLIIAGLSGWIAESVAAASAYWQSGIDVPVPRPLAYLLLPYRRTPIGFGTDPLFDRSLIVTCVATALAPILLLLLRQTLVRYSVRRHHMARGAAYSTAWLPILAIAYLGARVWSIGGWRALVFFAPGQTSWDSWAPVLDAIDTRMLWVGERPWIAAAASVTWQSAYWLSFTRLYLRLPHSVGLTVSLLAVSWLGAVLMVGLWPGSPLFSELGNAIFGLRP
jgi:hypothetical protein